MTNTTIASIATPLGPGGIGIIRISGPDARAIMRKLFVRRTCDLKHFNDQTEANADESHRVYYGYIRSPDSGAMIDEVIAFYMQAPRSFTREDVVELHSHSGFVVLDQILGAVVDCGARLAVAGEFTKRAFLNGRIDLSQAESVIDLINAPCEKAAHMASQQIAGGIRKVVDRLSTQLNALRAKCEAYIEFSEDIDASAVLTEIQFSIREGLQPDIAALIQKQKDCAIFREGLHLTIAGAPNVGKSSLLNRLAERETAIVSDIPGTTRDVVKEYFSINGVPIVLCDTAGIHDTNDPVECLGIEKAREQIQRADLVLMVFEAIRDINAFEQRLIDQMGTQKTIAVINKEDIADQQAVSKLNKKLRHIRHIYVSAKIGGGIDALKQLIFKEFISGKRDGSTAMVTPNLRQRKILERALAAIQLSLWAAEKQEPLELVSELLERARAILGEISGNPTNGDIYDHIFSQFCVGK